MTAFRLEVLSLRRLRLFSGLVLMAFALTHFINHAFGLVSFTAMDTARGWLGFWHRSPYWQLLLLAFLVHILAALVALYRRRQLRLPAWQWLQLGTGLLIPPFLALHYVGSRGVFQALGIPIGYAFELYMIWPNQAWQQTWLLLLVWVHGCVGVHYWLRLEPWYGRVVDLLLAMAVLVPALALAGFVTAGRQLQAKAAAEPEWLAELAARQRWPSDAADLAFVFQGETLITWVFLALVALTLIARLARQQWVERRNSVLVRFAGDREVRVPKGTSLLEASRAAGIAHASVCGGRGRCSTCRVQVTDGLDGLPPPAPAEQRVLQRLSAPSDVRLACQTRATRPVAMRLLMPATTAVRNARRPMDPSHGVEREVTVLFADLRGFTRLSEQRLPYDTVYVLNRYFQAMGAAIEAAGGHVDKFIGDGIMALFGLDGDASAGARRSLKAAIAMEQALERLNTELEGDLPEPLRMVVALHQGTAIVGEMGYGRSTSLTAIGDAVNVTSRLEGIAKENDVPLVVSAELLESAGVSGLDLPTRTVAIRGRRQPLVVSLIQQPEDLPTMTLEPVVGPPPGRWSWTARARIG